MEKSKLRGSVLNVEQENLGLGLEKGAGEMSGVCGSTTSHVP